MVQSINMVEFHAKLVEFCSSDLKAKTLNLKRTLFKSVHREKAAGVRFDCGPDLSGKAYTEF
jgi:hypothetical protein